VTEIWRRVIVSSSGQQAFVLVHTDPKRYGVENLEAVVLRFRVEHADAVTVGVLMDPLWTAMVQPKDWNLPPASPNVIEALAEAALGSHLDEMGLQGFNTRVVTVELFAPRLKILQSRLPADDESAHTYILGKVWWAWKFGVRSATFTYADQIRLGRPLRELRQLAEPDIDTSWKIYDPADDVFVLEALPPLLKHARNGTLPISPFGTLLDIRSKLRIPRYAAPLAHMEKAIAFLTESPVDLENASKEALTALESMAKIVAVAAPAATLGDALTALHKAGRIHPALKKTLDGIWGFGSVMPGQRHGGQSVPATSEPEARIVVNVAAAAMSFLRDIDK
jgi:hypothetical protein